MLDANITTDSLLHPDIDLPPMGLFGYTYAMENFSKLKTVTLNIRLLLWQLNPSSETWADLLHTKANIDKDLAVEILRDIKPPSSEDMKRICDAFSRTEEDLSFSRLLNMSKDDVIVENIKFIVTHLPQGEQKAVAEKINVAPETVSRWNKCKSPPTKPNQAALMRHIGLDPALIEQPLFLSMEPIGDSGKKRWLSERVEKIQPEELSSLFPALKKLLDDHAGN